MAKVQFGRVYENTSQVCQPESLLFVEGNLHTDESMVNSFVTLAMRKEGVALIQCNRLPVQKAAVGKKS